jgi:hypothetical protein
MFAYVLMVLYSLIEHFKKHEGVEFVTMGYISDNFKKRNPVAAGGATPAPAGSILGQKPSC